MDKILRAAVFNSEVSAAVIKTTDLVNKAISIHNLSPLSAAALGRTLTAAAYMCSGLKNASDSLSVSIKGDGAGGGIFVSGNAALEMRGYIENPHAELPPNKYGKLDVAGCVGAGSLTVIKDLGLKMPFNGTIELVSGEIAQDFAEYFLKSEQTPTAVALGVKIGTNLQCLGAGGVIISPLPGCSEDSLKKAEALLPELSRISTLMENLSAGQILNKFFGEVTYEEYLPRYHCNCSREKLKSVLAALGKDEFNSIIEEQGKVSIHCRYCNKDYIFYEKDAEGLF